MDQRGLCLPGNINYRRMETSVLFDVTLSVSRTIPDQKTKKNKKTKQKKPNNNKKNPGT